jgi:hypothetical protein
MVGREKRRMEIMWHQIIWKKNMKSKRKYIPNYEKMDKWRCNDQ